MDGSRVRDSSGKPGAAGKRRGLEANSPARRDTPKDDLEMGRFGNLSADRQV